MINILNGDCHMDKFVDINLCGKMKVEAVEKNNKILQKGNKIQKKYTIKSPIMIEKPSDVKP